LSSNIDGKVLGAHPDVDAGMMAGDWCFNLPWSGKGKNLLRHVMTHPTSGGRAAAVSFRDGISPGPQNSRFKAKERLSGKPLPLAVRGWYAKETTKMILMTDLRWLPQFAVEPLLCEIPEKGFAFSLW